MRAIQLTKHNHVIRLTNHGHLLAFVIPYGIWKGLRDSCKSWMKYAKPTNKSQMCHGVSNGTKYLCGQLSQVIVHIIISLCLGVQIWSSGLVLNRPLSKTVDFFWRGEEKKLNQPKPTPNLILAALDIPFSQAGCTLGEMLPKSSDFWSEQVNVCHLCVKRWGIQHKPNLHSKSI